MTSYPEWILEEVRSSKAGLHGAPARKTALELKKNRLHTVCDEALCPNKGKCFDEGEATFLILGDICTRACSFCAVQKKKPLPPDPGEPLRAARLTKQWELKYVVFTSPTRDDLSDGGASHFAETVTEIKRLSPKTGTEPLIPDFGGSRRALETVLSAGPSVLGHNIETVPALYQKVRRGADYSRSLALLAFSKAIRPDIFTKSGLMLGVGETDAEIVSVMKDLRDCGCDLLTIGQYLPPSKNHLPVIKYYTPGEFALLEKKAQEMGFKASLCGPLVRSSYHAGQLYRKAGGAP